MKIYDEINNILCNDEKIEYKKISLPCSGKANLLYFIKSFETGADGLVLITCSKNECRYLEGNLRSPKRAEQVNMILEEIGMGRGRIAVLNSDGKGIESLIPEIKEFGIKLQAMA